MCLQGTGSRSRRFLESSDICSGLAWADCTRSVHHRASPPLVPWTGIEPVTPGLQPSALPSELPQEMVDAEGLEPTVPRGPRFTARVLIQSAHVDMFAAHPVRMGYAYIKREVVWAEGFEPPTSRVRDEYATAALHPVDATRPLMPGRVGRCAAVRMRWTVLGACPTAQGLFWRLDDQRDAADPIGPAAVDHNRVGVGQ